LDVKKKRKTALLSKEPFPDRREGGYWGQKGRGGVKLNATAWDSSPGKEKKGGASQGSGRGEVTVLTCPRGRKEY